MKRTLLKSKLHRATVTSARLHYNGSLTVDRELMELADLVPHERVEIYNVTNGQRLGTYVIEGERGSREIIINGAAAHRAGPGDVVIICSYAEFENSELASHTPRVVLLGERNKILSAGAQAPVEAGVTNGLET